MISTSHAKNSTMPGMAYPATVLALATSAQLPADARPNRYPIDPHASPRARPLSHCSALCKRPETDMRHSTPAELPRPMTDGPSIGLPEKEV
jgi:hypothetical protein